jgi:predicted nucleic acid-binding protein
MPLFLDTGVLGLVTHPKGSGDATACLKWMRDCIAAGSIVCVPEIADYELRRELIRIKSAGLAKLDALPQPPAIQYVPLTTPVMKQAAAFWAQLRQAGKPTAPHHALDGDVILAAQAHGFGGAVIVITTNVADLGRLTDAREWTNVPAGKY